MAAQDNDSALKLDRRGFLRLVVAGGSAVAIGGLAGCGGGGGGGGGGGDFGEIPIGAISDDDRFDLLDALQEFLTGNGHLSLDEQAAAALTWTRAQPEFVDSDLNEDGVWAIFVDAVPLMLLFNREPDPDEFAEPLASGGRAPTDLPDNTTARLINTLGPAYRDFTPLFAPLLLDKGYSTVIDAGTVESLRAFNDDGIFLFVGAHAGKTNVPILNVDGNFIITHPGPPPKIKVRTDFGVWTSTVADRATVGPYMDDIAHGRLGFGVALHGNGQPGNRDKAKHYWFTAAFVDAYMNFGSDSLVWYNACQSHNALSVQFVQSCIAAGAGLYVGWNKRVRGSEVRSCTTFVLDRLLGSNTTSPLEVPPQRPFDYVKVWQNMAAQGLPSGLVYTVGSGNFGLLAPTIAYVLINEYDERAHLYGIFGNPASNEREVLIGGTPVTVSSWTPDEIVVELPRSGAGSSGDVEVQVRGHKSNLRQITHWRIEFNYSWTHTELPGLIADGVFVLEFRADIGHYRENPGVPPLEPIRWALGSKDSHGLVEATGTETDNGCEHSWSGIAQYFPAGFGIPPNRYIVSRMKIDSDNQTGALGLALGELIPPPFTWTVVCPGQPPTQEVFTVNIGVLGGNQNFGSPQPGAPEIPLPALDIAFGSDYRIPAIHYIDDTFAPLKIDITWPEVIPTSPPDPNASRSPDQ